MKLEIRKTGINGEGIGYLNQKPVFIPGTFPGDIAEIELLEENERYAKGRKKQIISPASCRRDSACPAPCGSCPLIEMKYHEQLNQKRLLLTEALWKYAHVREEFVRDIRPSSAVLYYRSSFKLPVKEVDGRLCTGMYKTGTNIFVPIEDCPVHDRKLEQLRKTVLAILREEHISAYDSGHGLRYLVMRRIEPVVTIALITGRDQLPETLIRKLSLLPEVESIVQSVNTERNTPQIFGSASAVLYGSETVTVPFHGFQIRLSPESFFQLNLSQAEALYQTAADKVDPCGVLAECYCGVGVMSLMVKDKARKVFGFEAVPQAIENANETAALNRVPNLTFRCADSAQGLKALSAEREVDILLADPPRSGMDDAMIDAILKSGVKKIIYVSCSPSTLAKNIRDLKQEFELRTVIPFDLFPNTPHVESVTVLTRRGTSDRTPSRRRRRNRSASMKQTKSDPQKKQTRKKEHNNEHIL